MLKLSPQSAEGLHKLSQDIQTLYKNHNTQRTVIPQTQEPQQEQYVVRFGFLDVLKISGYFIITIGIIKATFLILNW